MVSYTDRHTSGSCSAVSWAHCCIRCSRDAQRAAAYPRPDKSETVIDLNEKKAKAASDQQLRKWGRLDSNQRPTDYEFAPPRTPHKGKRAFSLFNSGI